MVYEEQKDKQSPHVPNIPWSTAQLEDPHLPKTKKHKVQIQSEK